MKKIIIFSLIMAIALIGCGGGSGGNSNQNGRNYILISVDTGGGNRVNSLRVGGVANAAGSDYEDYICGAYKNDNIYAKPVFVVESIVIDGREILDQVNDEEILWTYSGPEGQNVPLGTGKIRDNDTFSPGKRIFKAHYQSPSGVIVEHEVNVMFFEMEWFTTNYGQDRGSGVRFTSSGMVMTNNISEADLWVDGNTVRAPRGLAVLPGFYNDTMRLETVNEDVYTWVNEHDASSGYWTYLVKCPTGYAKVAISGRSVVLRENSRILAEYTPTNQFTSF